MHKSITACPSCRTEAVVPLTTPGIPGQKPSTCTNKDGCIGESCDAHISKKHDLTCEMLETALLCDCSKCEWWVANLEWDLFIFFAIYIFLRNMLALNTFFHPIFANKIKFEFRFALRCYYSADYSAETTTKPVTGPTNGGFKFKWQWQKLQGADCVSTMASALQIGKTARCWPCWFVLPRMLHGKWTNKCHCKSCILLG